RNISYKLNILIYNKEGINSLHGLRRGIGHPPWSALVRDEVDEFRVGFRGGVGPRPVGDGSQQLHQFRAFERIDFAELVGKTLDVCASLRVDEAKPLHGTQAGDKI